MCNRKSLPTKPLRKLFSTAKKMAMHRNRTHLFLCIALFVFVPRLFAQAGYRVHSDYEDTLRVAVIWNDAAGSCNDETRPVGEKTRDFVLASLGGYVDHVEVLRNSQSDHVTWEDVEALWGDSIPHVIVHVNAGWSTGWNGSELEEIFENAVARKIGIVSVGDDAANLASQTFGFGGVDNVPSPLGDGNRQGVDGGGPIDSLWVGLLPNNDNRLKQYDADGALLYPGVNGVISNAIDNLMQGDTQLDFYPAGEGRCQADADEYNILYPQWITKLGYQQGHWNNRTRPGSDELHVLVAIQDTMPDETIRRGVAVSYQPQFLQNVAAAQQITYDAIMFASLAHTLSVASGLQIVTRDTSISAGDTTALNAMMIDQFGKQITDHTTLSLITWTILPTTRRDGDRMVDATGEEALFTAIQAHRSAHIVASFTGDEGTLLDTAIISIVPDTAHHLVIENNPDGMSSPNDDNSIGGSGYVRFSSSETEKHAWAVIRDRFGNYIENSRHTLWDTLSPGGIVTAKAYDQQTGDGIITKVGTDGSTSVFARSGQYDGALFSDTITIGVDAVLYDSLRIMTYQGGETFYTDSLVMVTGRDTSLIVEGFRSDFDTWEQVPGSWSLSQSLRTDVVSPEEQAVWGPFAPVDTGSGWIEVVYGNISTALPATFLAGTPQLLALYPREGSPQTQQPYTTYPTGTADTVSAGETFEIWAKLFDINSVWLPSFETDPAKAAQISWQISTDEELEYHVDGAHLTISSTQAYRTVMVTASVIIDGTTMSQTAAIYITHGRPDHLVIEASATIANMVNDDPVDHVTIPSTQSSRSVFAVLRDAWGNFAGYSTNTDWFSRDTNVFTAAAGDAADVGEGVAQKVYSGTALLVAEDVQSGFTDTIGVTVQNYYHDELRIVNAAGDTVDTLRMNTNQDTTLLVIGLRSDTSMWEPVQARWNNTDNLLLSPTAPLLSDQWTFTPTDTASSGRIEVSQGDNSVTAPFQTHVIFDPGPPTDIDIDILTPPENRIAGEPIEASVIIRNDDGEVPGTWCGDVVFDDLLQGDNQNEQAPQAYVIVHGDTISLSQATEICFEGGNTIVQLVLFDASIDNVHTMSVFYSDETTHAGLTDSEKLVLNPGPVEEIDIVQNSEEPFPGDTILLDFSDGVSVRSIGYDRFGNYIGSVPTQWSSGGNIPQYTSTDRMSQIYYSVDNVLYESEGIIKASYGQGIDDLVHVRIRPQPAEVIGAITRDRNGNGYLDAIEITFNKEVTVGEDFNLSDILVEYFDRDVPYSLPTHSITPAEGISDSVFTIALEENPDLLDGRAQTDWKPRLTLTDATDAGVVSSVTCDDGAGPVVWSVTRHVSSDGDRTKDKISVTFSEDLFTTDGTPLPFTTRPADLFTVWVDSTGTISPIGLFDDISSLSSVNPGQVEFYMTNGNELTSYNLISFNSANAPVVDESGLRNSPAAENRRTRLIVIGRAGSINVGPSPLRPTFRHTVDHLQAQQPHRAYEWARNEGGTVFVADIIVPGSDSTRSRHILEYNIQGSMMIFDAIGNLVYERKGFPTQIIEQVSDQHWIPGTTQQLVFYWNGFTDRGFPAAPGIYRVIMYLQIDGEQMRLTSNLGIGR